MIYLLQAEIKMRLGVRRYCVIAIELRQKIRRLVINMLEGDEARAGWKRKASSDGAAAARKKILAIIYDGGGISIVVIPFAALIADLVNWVQWIGVDVIEFQLLINSKRESLPRAARIVVLHLNAGSAKSY
ncbi:hypothetical protein B0J13DRAFT_534827 [Dactylonectria estremocensis]|uniref:Uncharacterized protein n=1 Tax=Dactylonectria estremocensis TaxID=1079267 RepID=A0A9P9CY35_9HYPO|nr:hypothetical protein B0J13DRAFT_534827 [Dactylonectria estremocensis]